MLKIQVFQLKIAGSNRRHDALIKIGLFGTAARNPPVELLLFIGYDLYFITEGTNKIMI